MAKIILSDVNCQRELVIDLSADNAVEGDLMRLPISDIIPLTSWTDLNWKNVAFIYENQITLSRRSDFLYLSKAKLECQSTTVYILQLHEQLELVDLSNLSIDRESMGACASWLASTSRETLTHDIARALESEGLLSNPCAAPALDDREDRRADGDAVPPPVAPRHLVVDLRALFNALQLRLFLKILFFIFICSHNRMMRDEKKYIIIGVGVVYYLYHTGALSYCLQKVLRLMGLNDHQEGNMHLNPPDENRQQNEDNGNFSLWQQLLVMSRQGLALPRGPGLLQDFLAIFIAFFASLFPEWNIQPAAGV